MDASVQNWVWAGAGVALLASEGVAPHLVTGFLGAGALTVAALRFLGVVDDTFVSVGLWALSSTVYLVALRRLLVRWFGEAEKTRHSTCEDVRALATEVDVVETVGPETPGRIRFDGTTWAALSTGATLEAGSRARLLRRDNLAWVVEPVEVAVETVPARVRTN